MSFAVSTKWDDGVLVGPRREGSGSGSWRRTLERRGVTGDRVDRDGTSLWFNPDTPTLVRSLGPSSGNPLSSSPRLSRDTVDSPVVLLPVSVVGPGLVNGSDQTRGPVPGEPLYWTVHDRQVIRGECLQGPETPVLADRDFEVYMERRRGEETVHYGRKGPRKTREVRRSGSRFRE